MAANVTFADKKLAYAQVNLDNNVDADEWIGTNTSPYRCINLDSITDIRSKLNIPSANTHIEAMTGCGLAVLDIASGKTTFDNTEWDNTATNGNS
ncbi:MAG: hypothetical protein DHS20C13_27090 [Thermodesulfobacteriota bacterium]|nr:MAG: hypothetical protein DHS20C13_27090 [Thermodesulfobacteriota bacterium]